MAAVSRRSSGHKASLPSGTVEGESVRRSGLGGRAAFSCSLSLLLTVEAAVAAAAATMSQWRVEGGVGRHQHDSAGGVNGCGGECWW